MPADTAPKPPALAVSDADAANLLNVSRSHFRQLVRDGRAPSPFKLGRASRWRVQELRDWIAAGAPPRHKWAWTGRVIA